VRTDVNLLLEEEPDIFAQAAQVVLHGNPASGSPSGLLERINKEDSGLDNAIRITPKLI